MHIYAHDSSFVVKMRNYRQMCVCETERDRQTDREAKREKAKGIQKQKPRQESNYDQHYPMSKEPSLINRIF